MAWLLLVLLLEIPLLRVSSSDRHNSVVEARDVRWAGGRAGWRAVVVEDAAPVGPDGASGVKEAGIVRGGRERHSGGTATDGRRRRWLGALADSDPLLPLPSPARSPGSPRYRRCRRRHAMGTIRSELPRLENAASLSGHGGATSDGCRRGGLVIRQSCGGNDEVPRPSLLVSGDRSGEAGGGVVSPVA
ncbi:unnamed protein product [Lampetra fluviatilis]